MTRSSENAVSLTGEYAKVLFDVFILSQGEHVSVIPLDIPAEETNYYVAYK